MFGISIPYSYLRDGGSICGEFPYRKGEVCLIPSFLSTLGVTSAELRSVGRSETPEAVLDAANILWNSGIAVSVHRKVHSAESAVHDVFAPTELLIKNLPAAIQKRLIITVHPIESNDLVEENTLMPALLAEHILKKRSYKP